MRSVFSVLALVFAMSPAVASALDPKDILDKFDDMYRGYSSHGTMIMKVNTEHWSRELEIEMWSKGKDKSLARILSPKKEKGTATLRSDNNIWNYLPKVKRTIKVPGSMMGGSWMGSHFTNDDLVKESRMSEDYTFSITFEGERKGKQVIEITCIPKEDAAVVWGKVTVEVDAKDHSPITIGYYDEDMELARTMTFDSYQMVDKRKIPMKTRVTPADKPNEYTEVTYKDIEFDVDVSDSMFTLRSLQR